MQSKPSIVLVGGLSVRPVEWQPFIDNLPDRSVRIVDRSILEHDQPGSELSRVRHELANWDTEIDHIAEACLQEHQLGGPVILVGHSMGAMLAEGVARLHPDLVGRLILLDGTIPYAVRGDITRKSIVLRSGVELVSASLAACAHWATARPMRAAAVKVTSIISKVRETSGDHAEQVAQELASPTVAKQIGAEFFADLVWAKKLARLQEQPLPARIDVVIALGTRNPLGLVQRRWELWWRNRVTDLRAQAVKQTLKGNRCNIVSWLLPRCTHMIMGSQPRALARIIGA